MKPRSRSATALACCFASASGFSTVTPPPSKLTSSSRAPTKDYIRAQQVEAERKAYEAHDNVAFNSLFANVQERSDPLPIANTSGEQPADFPPGCLLRIGPNGALPDEGFFDGDGMIHCVTFPPKEDDEISSTYSATYVDTKGRQLEREYDKRFVGTLGAVPQGLPVLGSIIQNAINFRTLEGQKDTCNTALAMHGERLLALMEQCPPTEISVHRDGHISTVEAKTSLDGAVPVDVITGGSLSAHGRTCPWNGERVHVSYGSSKPPYIRVDTFKTTEDGSAGWKLQNSVGVDVECPTMVHDCDLTKNFVVLLDFPLTIRTSRFARNQFPVEYEPEYGARIGLLPRKYEETSGQGENSRNDDILWFDVQPGVVLHTVNAYETTDPSNNHQKVILHALRSEPDAQKSYLSDYAASYLYRYELDLTTGQVISEDCINGEDIIEFPVVPTPKTEATNESNGDGLSPPPHVYSASVKSIGGPLQVLHQPTRGILLDGVTKHSLRDDDGTLGQLVDKFVLDERWFGISEPTVVPKTTGDGEYVLLVATHVPTDLDLDNFLQQQQENGTGQSNYASAGYLTSKVFVLDGDDLSEPVWTQTLPHHLNYGLHSKFVEWDKMKE